MPPTVALLPPPALNPSIVLRPAVAGTVVDPGPSRAIVCDPGKGIDTYSNDPVGPMSFANLDIVAGATAENYGGQIAGSIDRLRLTRVAFSGWNIGLSCEKIAAPTGLSNFLWIDCHWTDSGTAAVVLGDAHGGTILRGVFDRGGWNPQGERTDPAQTHLLYINPDNCSEIVLDSCYFNDARMGAARCCGTVCKKSVFVNVGIGALGGSITRTISACVITLTHDLAPGDARGGMGINADSPDGLLVSVNLVAHAGDGATGNLWAMGVHGSAGRQYKNVAYQGNIVYDWFNNGTGCAMGWGADPGENCQCTGNQLQMVNGGKCVDVNSGTLANIRFGGNFYWSPDPKPFAFNGVEYTWEEWKALTNDATSRFVRIDYVDPTRSVARFVAEVLGLVPDDPGAQLAGAMRLYPGLGNTFRLWMLAGFKPKDE